jgi:hypothetical protein
VPKLLPALLLCSATAWGQAYSTAFTATENPLSEGGVWLNGGTLGLDWGNVQSGGGKAFGVSLPSTYADPTAVLTGSWGADQSASAVVRMPTQPSGCCYEVELRLRTSISAHTITGYEVLFSVTSNAYVQVVRWNGPLADSSNSNNGFTYVGSATGPGLHDGDVVSASISGPTITVFQNGTQLLQATDTGQGGVAPVLSGGSPGVGFFDNADTNWSGFGLSNFTASAGGDAGVGFDAGTDAGTDAGNGSGGSDSGVDAGPPSADAGPGAGGTPLTGGCGCSGLPGASMLLLVVALWRRSRARPSGRPLERRREGC